MFFAGAEELQPVLSTTPLQKRIKRHLIARRHRFYAATAPGLEAICSQELKSFLPDQSLVAAVEGGAEFDGRLHDAYLANLNLHTANRILMRIRDFYAADFRQLESNLKAIPWELYLNPQASVRVHASSRKSRLYHKAAVAQRLREIITGRLNQYRDSATRSPYLGESSRIFVRTVQNQMVISIDSSGELLHKRGIKHRGARAPLRETLAAAALMLARYSGAEPLIDPMCGSGSFSLEAALMAQRIPPGWYRNFAFMSWPSFQPGRWRHLRHQAEVQFRPADGPIIFASDRDESTVNLLRENLSRHGLTQVVSAAKREFFEFSPGDLTDRPGLVTLNPPYGLRMGSRRESDALFREICGHLKSAYRRWRFALIAPRMSLLEAVPFQSTLQVLPLGGIRIALLTGLIP